MTVASDNFDLLTRIRQHLPKGRDLTMIIIKGHLLVEERLHGLVANAVRDDSRLADARLTFFQSLCLCEAICGSSWDECWRFARRLNEVRNRLAHRLDHGDLNELVDSILSAYDATAPSPSSSTERARWLKNAIMIVCGLLEGLRVGQKHSKVEMEEAWRSRRGITKRCNGPARHGAFW